MAFAAEFPERVRRLALWNPAQPGSSPRTTGLAHLPDISATHFHEYIELAALKFFGWDNPEGAKRWIKSILRQFNGQTWQRMIETMEAVDATDKAAAVRCPTLIMIDPNGMDRHQARRTEFMKRLAATIPDGELAILRPNGPGYAEIVEGFLGREEARTTSRVPTGTAVILFADIVDSRR
jgi:pimeloyl-ACP methyl ester carboxylesterase